METNVQHLEITPELEMVNQEETTGARSVVCATTTLGLAVSEAIAEIVESLVTKRIYAQRRE
jgi:hypothetical protein